jgi:hypothetical protein
MTEQGFCSPIFSRVQSSARVASQLPDARFSNDQQDKSIFGVSIAQAFKERSTSGKLDQRTSSRLSVALGCVWLFIIKINGQIGLGRSTADGNDQSRTAGFE